jgi:hypothetical protein
MVQFQLVNMTGGQKQVLDWAALPGVEAVIVLIEWLT